MAEYVLGSSEDQEELAEQLERLHDVGFAVVVGSFARQAMYAHYGYEAPPLSLERQAGEKLPWPESGLRDIDVVLPYGVGKPHQTRTGIYPVDLRVHHLLFKHRGGYQIGLKGQPHRVDPKVVETRVSMMPVAGRLVPVPTFAVGTHYCLEGLWRVSGISGDKYNRAREQFAAFAREVQQVCPDEFLPAELYAPFRACYPEAPIPVLGETATSDVETGDARESIAIQSQPVQPSLATVGEVVGHIAAVRDVLIGDETGVTSGIATAQGHLDQALGSVYSLFGVAAEDNPIAAALADAQRHAQAAVTILHFANDQLGDYQQEIGGVIPDEG